MKLYAPELTLREARSLYFDLNNFGGDGGYGERWVKMRAGPLPIWFPNTSARVRAVKFHDLHHVLTEYPTTWRGEAEISAWEIATGCALHYPAWLLNLQSFAIGLVINPRGIFRAFVRGRQSAGNLYRTEFGDELLEGRVGDFRARLWLDRPARGATFADAVGFAFWSAMSAATLAATGLGMVAPFIILAFLLLW